MFNTKLLMSDAKSFSTEQQINPYYTDEDVDKALAEREHDSIRQLFTSAGVEVVSVGAPTDSQDGVYTANWALVRGKKAVLARLPEARKSEEAWAQGKLSELGYEVISVPEDWHFSGQGDALACGEYLFCGQGYRSDIRSQEFAAAILGYKRIQLKTVPELDADGQPMINPTSGWPDSFYYDLDLALSILREPSEGTRGFACNLVSTGETVIMSAHAPELRSAIESHGLKVVSPEVTELIKGGGFIRCTSLRLV